VFARRDHPAASNALNSSAPLAIPCDPNSTTPMPNTSRASRARSSTPLRIPPATPRCSLPTCTAPARTRSPSCWLGKKPDPRQAHLASAFSSAMQAWCRHCRHVRSGRGAVVCSDAGRVLATVRKHRSAPDAPGPREGVSAPGDPRLRAHAPREIGASLMPRRRPRAASQPPRQAGNPAFAGPPGGVSEGTRTPDRLDHKQRLRTPTTPNKMPICRPFAVLKRPAMEADRCGFRAIRCDSATSGPRVAERVARPIRQPTEAPSSFLWATYTAAARPRSRAP
jgi:hypothetical protein